MKKSVILLILLLGSRHGYGEELLSPFHDEDVWVRVADGCTALSLEEVLQLATMSSLQCATGFQPTGPNLKMVKPYCGPTSVNTGSITLIDGHRLILTATDFEDGVDNPWGVLFRHWQFFRVGKVLIMLSPQAKCADGVYKIYLIPSPTA